MANLASELNAVCDIYGDDEEIPLQWVKKELKARLAAINYRVRDTECSEALVDLMIRRGVTDDHLDYMIKHIDE